jgi:glutathione S-transferase
MGLTIYIGNKNYSSWSLRGWLALAQTGAPFEEVMIPLDRPDSAERIRAVTHAGRVPALRDGDFLVWDSLAICEYLAERYPEAKLWPADPRARAVARAVSAEMHSGFAALRTSMTCNIRRKPAPITVGDDVRADIARILEIWSQARARHAHEGDFLFGPFTIADAMFAPVVTRFRSYAVPLDGVAAAYAQAIWSHPPMKAWEAAALVEPLRIEKYEAI